MSIVIDTEPQGDGLCITRVSTTDRVVEIPPMIDGVPVVAIAESFMTGSPSMGARTLMVPSTVVSIHPDALEGSTGITVIEFDGELEDFMPFKVVNAGDCTLRCRLDGKPYSFGFLGNYPMSFPEFDDAILAMYLGLTLEIAGERLTNPLGLNDVNRAKYERFVSERIMPRAEQAIGTGDTGTLMGLLSTGMVSDDDLDGLLERSLRSGRVPVTSVLMSEIRRRALSDDRE